MPPPSAALDAGDGWLLHLGQYAQHLGQGAGVVEVVVEAVVGGALHPVEVGPGREALAAAGEDDDANVDILIECDTGGGDFGDEGFVEGIVAVGAVHPERGDRSAEFYLEGLEGHVGCLLNRYFCLIGVGVPPRKAEPQRQ
jgi:hypothetical protein